MEIPVVENLTFLSCAEAGETPIIKKRITRKGIDLMRISTPLDGAGMFTTETDRGIAATNAEKKLNHKRTKVT